jgi:integrase
MPPNKRTANPSDPLDRCAIFMIRATSGTYRLRSGYAEDGPASVAGLLRTARQHGWAPGLDAHVDLYRDDYPRLNQSQPRALSEAVMAQLEHADNLARSKDPRGRLLLQILMCTGLRVGDGCKLALDCIVRDAQSAHYLHYTKNKMRREAFVHIDTDLADAITRRQQAVLADLPSATFLLPGPTRNPDGQQPFSTATFHFRDSRSVPATPVWCCSEHRPANPAHPARG